MSCSMHCAPSCMSRGHPPGVDGPGVDQLPKRSVGRSYPVADPEDAQLNWQMIAVRHAWKKASQGDFEGLEDSECVSGSFAAALPGGGAWAAHVTVPEVAARKFNSGDKVFELRSRTCTSPASAQDALRQAAPTAGGMHAWMERGVASSRVAAAEEVPPDAPVVVKI